ncbi:MAG: acyl-CoA dehydratase activase-related protein, partial [Candidatus Spyradocola sp.]
MRIGLDVGSTTLKCVVLSERNEILYKDYQRHYSQITQKAATMLRDIHARLPQEHRAQLCISGSAGMGFAEGMGIPFVQEVYATRVAIRRELPDTDVVIELGGEDAKILFTSGNVEVRMNGSCAGGTGAFIDQMATLLRVEPDQMNELSKHKNKIYSIASRCGVFAKSDIQPLLNQGARKEDVCASIFTAVVNQTIAGLAQGREIAGHVVYLGGPLTFFSELRAAFDDALGTQGLLPDNSLHFVALGAALQADGDAFDMESITKKIENYSARGTYVGCRPLFESKEDYEAFCDRHGRDEMTVTGKLQDDNLAVIGIDAGSTTVKAVVLDSQDNVAFYRYMPNSGNPVPLVRTFLQDVYRKFPGIKIQAAASTGYGEEIIKNAFHADCGIVETIAHFTAASKFDPQVDFIIDIGGQDIKCFKIKDGVIDNIFLNEACSSGCGSFLQTFAGALGYTIEDFAKKGLFADKPVDLGSRCTVFMNSSVKQAQKDGASIENISAGLSISVVKNALYKVIRVGSVEELGEHIVVQGGTFLNDAVLRAFEQEIGRDVIRPSLAGLMGAVGAALYARAHRREGGSSLLTAQELEGFTHQVQAVTCKGCTNHCRLTINTFADGKKFIGGNQCAKPLSTQRSAERYNLCDYKRELLSQYGDTQGARQTIGLPMGLNFYELLPFWHTFFTDLGFGVKLSPKTTKQLYHLGQASIPSDTACYPAKLMHGHVQALVDAGVDAIFYPCMSYNFDEHLGDNHYNCPVVAYYPEVIVSNMKSVRSVRFIKDYVGIHRPHDFPKKMCAILQREFGQDITPAMVRRAAKKAYAAYDEHMRKVRDKGQEYLRLARERGLPVIVLAGRPYHLDGEINHGIDGFIADSGAVVVSEDSLGDEYVKAPTTVLNQWTYHSRLYAAARFIAQSGDPHINLVQLVSFGCGVDAITTDE